MTVVPGDLVRWRERDCRVLRVLDERAEVQPLTGPYKDSRFLPLLTELSKETA